MPESVVMPELGLITEANSPPATRNNEDFSAMVDHSTSHTASSFSTHVSGSPKPARDSSWLQVDLCRDFQRDTCPRGHSCRFAHPESRTVVVKEGKVTCCYDFLKDRCQRALCKYYHPPGHIKEKLVCAGKQFGAMMSTTSVLSPPAIPAAMSPTLHNVGANGYGPESSMATPTLTYPERLAVCPEYAMGYCPILLCPYAHPGPCVRRNPDLSVTVCHNFMRWVCTRGDSCRFYHPLPHQVLGPMPVQGFFQPGQAVPCAPFLAVQPQSPLPMFYPFQQQLPHPAIPSTSFMPSPPAGGMVPLTPPHLVGQSFPGPYFPPPQQMFAVPVSVIEGAMSVSDNSGVAESET